MNKEELMEWEEREAAARHERMRDCAEEMFFLLEYVSQAIATQSLFLSAFERGWARIEGKVRRDAWEGDPQEVTR